MSAVAEKPEDEKDEGESAESILAPVFAPGLDLLDDIGGTVTLGFQAFAWLVRPPFRIAQLFNALDFIGAGSTFIVALVGIFTGMAFTVSTIVGFRQFSAENMVGGVVALALARELAPVLASLIVTPMLAIVFGIAGMFGAWVVGVIWQGIDPGLFIDRVRQFLMWRDLRMCVVKAIVFGGLVSIICCKKGFYATGGARGVGEATAKAVVASIVVIFCADYVLTTLMTDI